MKNEDFRDSMIQSSRDYYQNMFGQSIGEAFLEFTLENSRARPETFFDQLSEALDEAYTREAIEDFRALGVILLLPALVAIYIGRLTKKMRVRNTKISENQKITQEVIIMFREAIAEEEQELIWMQEIMQKTASNGSVPPPLPE